MPIMQGVSHSGSMKEHWSRMHGTESSIDWNHLLVSQTEHLPHVFNVIFPKGTPHYQFPFLGFPRSPFTWNGLWNHFNRKHWGYILRILEEYPLPLPKCERCDIQVPPWRLNIFHYNSDKFQIGEECWRRLETLQNCFESSRVVISEKLDPMEPTTAFLYLYRTVAYNTSDWAALYQNLKKK